MPKSSKKVYTHELNEFITISDLGSIMIVLISSGMKSPICFSHSVINFYSSSGSLSLIALSSPICWIVSSVILFTGGVGALLDCLGSVALLLSLYVCPSIGGTAPPFSEAPY